MHVFWAHTAPVNPAGTTVPLTHAQLWKGLEIKSHRPTQFVGIMESSEVLEVRPNGLLRRILFKEGSTGPQGPIDEDIVFFGEMKVLYTFSLASIIAFSFLGGTCHRLNSICSQMMCA
jgi:hypothetical protein